MDVRRIVTGQTSEGASVVSDEQVPPITVGLMPGAEFTALWGSDEPVSVPVPQQASPKGWFPPLGGVRFGLVTLGPVSAGYPPDFDLAAALTELADRLPGMVEVLEPDHPGMHTTDTVDFVTLLSGEVWLELDNGRETLVQAGDTVVQTGTRHAWHNRTDRPATMAVALIGATRSWEAAH